MCIIFSLVPATVLAIVGYFILLSSTKAHGCVRVFGKILAVWVFLVAVVFPLMGTYATVSDMCAISSEQCPLMKMLKEKPEEPIK